MATSGATLITALSLRLRDSSNTAHPRDLLRRVLLQTQRVVNLAEKVRKTTAVVFTPPVGRTLFHVSEVAANVARIERIRTLDHTLPEVEWRTLVNNSVTWYRDLNPSHYTWARIGASLFVLTPAVWEPITVEVVYTTIPADITDDATNVDLPDEWIPLLMDLAEGIMLLKARLYHAMAQPMQRVTNIVKAKEIPSADTVNS